MQLLCRLPTQHDIILELRLRQKESPPLGVHSIRHYINKTARALSPRPIHVVIDALDELSDDSRSSLLRLLKGLTNCSNTYILFFCRRSVVAEIDKYFSAGSFITSEIAPARIVDDMHYILCAELAADPRPELMNHQLGANIMKTLGGRRYT